MENLIEKSRRNEVKNYIIIPITFFGHGKIAPLTFDMISASAIHNCGSITVVTGTAEKIYECLSASFLSKSKI